MKKALLIPFLTITGREGWQWVSPCEKDLSPEFDTRDEALSNRPEGFLSLDDGWQKI
jgi:hypothetical protein